VVVLHGLAKANGCKQPVATTVKCKFVAILDVHITATGGAASVVEEGAVEEAEAADGEAAACAAVAAVPRQTK
jgi:hypothetical protein